MWSPEEQRQHHLLEMHILGPHRRPAEPAGLGEGPSAQCLNKPSRSSCCSSGLRNLARGVLGDASISLAHGVSLLGLL